MGDDSITVSHGVGHLRMWGSLEILEEIGRGGFGVVYRAWEPVLAREVALKIIRPAEAHADALASILREGQLLARVRHPNVVTVYGAQQIGEEVGLWMELVRGRSLSHIVKSDGPRAAEEAAVAGISLCQALAAVHHAGVLHRDIKAHNVMREAGGRIVLMDFGAGQLFDAARRPQERTIGTPSYMAPEVLAGGRPTSRSDIYSVGVLLYYLVTGAYPVEGSSWTDFLLAHARFERRPLADVRPDVPAAFVRVVEKATALEPDERYPSPGAMLADLTSALAGGLPTRATPSGRRHSDVRTMPEPSAPQRPRRLVAQVAGPIAVPLALGAVATVTLNQTLGRSAAYADENVLQIWVWGVRALIPGAVQATVIVLLWLLLASLWKLVRRMSRGADAASAAVRLRAGAVARQLGLDDPETAAQALLAGQIVALSVFYWYFRDIFSAAISFIDEAAPEYLDPLRPQYLFRHQLYNFSMAMLILAMGAAGYRIVRTHRRPGAAYGWIITVFGVIGVSLVVLAFPYRVIWHNRFEVATFAGERCYILGEQPARALLYCPGRPPPRVREIPLPQPSLERSGFFESIYTDVNSR